MSVVHLAVVGGRDFGDYARLAATMQQIREDPAFCPEGAEVRLVSGGANGADTLAARYALEQRLAIVVLRPDWRRYGRGAGLQRNQDIVGGADAVVAFWDGASRGTANSIALARAAGKKLHLVLYGPAALEPHAPPPESAGPRASD